MPFFLLVSVPAYLCTLLLQKRYRRLAAAGLPEVRGLQPFLALLRERGVKIAAVTNAPR